ncbi:hypothetical protein GLW07_02590 [Bacillus hwajinpoensis]|uniref:DUF4181 domain-containing protein n=1 Tax=Guptibacillus hwajinpoensis TaxID=208199 RepID=A0A845ES24_9BACL|nr:hypothetical protein [Pseudalkalibacillus hwajinpoensis]MYL62237.1 hypothetical protein [Pseudalkalibacillus hwajinpoensis]
MNKQTVKNNSSKMMWRFINVALIASYIVLMFDSNTHNNLLATCLFTTYWFVRILRYGMKERAEGNQNRALYYFGLAIIVGMAIVAVGGIYLFGL